MFKRLHFAGQRTRGGPHGRPLIFTPRKVDVVFFTLQRVYTGCIDSEPLHRFLHRARQLSYLAVSTPLGAATAQAAPLPAAAAEVRKGWTELEDEEILRRHTPHATHHTRHATAP